MSDVGKEKIFYAVRLTKQQKKGLDRLAKAENSYLSVVVRRALDEFLERNKIMRKKKSDKKQLRQVARKKTILRKVA